MTEEMNSVTVRLRLSFEDQLMLNKSQKVEGLNQSWVLLKPQQHKTISQLSSHLLNVFNLNHTCPNGVILSMDGFVLPPFESTCILKDKDIVCVKKKFDKEIGCNASESKEEEDDNDEEPNQTENGVEKENAAAGRSASKKRKASKSLKGSKRKRIKRAMVEESVLESIDVEDDTNNKDNNSLGILPLKSRGKKHKSSDAQRGVKKSKASKSDETTNSNGKSLCEPHENNDGNVDASGTPGVTKKGPSRSARRKKAKRRWLREKRKAEKEEQQQKQLSEKDNCQSSGRTGFTQEHQTDKKSVAEEDKDNTELTQQHQLGQSSDEDGDVVPVVVRPGLIHFESLGKVDPNQTAQENHPPVETFRMNGITSKKRGQKWGKDKNGASKRNDHRNFYHEQSESATIEEAATLSEDIDFEKLKSYPGLPKEGDVVAYRLVELSSSWTPELSSFRVGKVSRYDPASKKVLLVPVPEYPITCEGEMDDDSSKLQTIAILYSEGGSLEVDFSALVDTRIVKPVLVSSSKSFTVDNQNSVISQPQNNNEETPTSSKDNESIDAWEKISRAIDAGKEQLSRENSWKKQPSSGKSSWSYKALRGSALGPVMSRLRSENGI